MKHCRDWESISTVFLPFMEETPGISFLLPPELWAALGAWIPWVPIQVDFLK